MLPRLHPDMGEVVICARVACQLSYLKARRLRGATLHPARIVSWCAEELPADYPGMLRFALHSLAVYLDLGMPSAVWLRNVLEASHYGSTFRRCFFFDYKENRRPHPRVTNRGVQSSRRRQWLPSEGDSSNG